ncbi:biotin-protein ligase [Jimgerdemannia flammicorona]|uniref:Biotin-protein ligase n=1 Tax=Jimgerdemannia flammicorona TaxID=994334 RepID=A0A433A2S5_9FUNG|nr:biotin-protein ligase [Jimgerdemannia flammicorona]
MNILVYSGDGTSRISISHTCSTLKALLGHSHDILQVDARTLQDDPWPETCSLLVVPGGRDLPYVRDLAGKANARIKQYVESGGRYWGICAGAYYASSSIEFEIANPAMVVRGDRELKFYPGISRGTVFPGFVYNSETGARAVGLNLNVDLLRDYYPTGAYLSVPNEIPLYYNGGGYFLEPHLHPPEDVEVLAWYAEQGDLDSGTEDPKAAVVQCRVGLGVALLVGVHPEYDSTRLDLTNPDYAPGVISTLRTNEDDRKRLVRALLARIGLEPVGYVRPSPRARSSVTTLNASVMENVVPNLTPLYLSGLDYESTRSVGAALRALGAKDPSAPGFDLVADANDTFRIGDATDKLPSMQHHHDKSLEEEHDPTKEVKTIMVCDTPGSLPTRGTTPFFDVTDFYARLRKKREAEFAGGKWFKFGSFVMYAEVVTSTQTMLDK